MKQDQPFPVAAWLVVALGAFLSIPGIIGALVSWIAGRPLSVLLLAAVVLLGPFVLGLPLLQRGRTLGRPDRWLAVLYLVLGGLWALAGPLAVLNLRHLHFFLAEAVTHPLALLLVGGLPPVVGMAFLTQVGTAWPPSRTHFRTLGGWIYLGVSILSLIGALATAVWGDPYEAISWLAQGSVIALISASLFERRIQATGAFFLALGLLMALLFLPTTMAGQSTTFVLNPPGLNAWAVSNAVFPTAPVLILLVAVAAALGGWQAMRQVRLLRLGAGGVMATAIVTFLVLLAVYYGLSTGFFLLSVLALTLGLAAWQILRTHESNGILGAILFLMIMAFLIWAGRSQEFNFTGILMSTLEAATPIALGALCGVWCERSAVINIGIEGIMLSSAFTSVIMASATKSLLLGLVVGLLTGALMGAVLAVLAIRFKVNHIIAGTAINILAIGLTSFLGSRLLAERQDLNASAVFPRIPIPILSNIPIIGPVFFQNNLIIYLMLILVVVTHVVLFYTRWGLRSRSVGEHPLAADTLGVNVIRTRYINVLIGGMIAGLGGVYFTLGSVGRFDEVMTAGRGFIGLAAMIFGRWTPFGAFGSSLIFGFASSLQIKLGILNVPIPSHFLLMAPYLATIIILAGVIGRAVAPAADGEPYEKN